MESTTKQGNYENFSGSRIQFLEFAGVPHYILHRV